jgi:ketosteroid isomerase-like protein
MNTVIAAILVCLLVGPTPDNALATDQELTQKLLANDAGAVGRLLADDWTMVPTEGGEVVNRAAFLAQITSGAVVRKTMVLSEPRVRLYGNIAVVTSLIATSGTTNGTAFDVKERQTDVWKWDGEGWKAVLTHETKILGM